MAALPEGTAYSGHPNVVWTGADEHVRPAEGYKWVSNSSSDYSVEPLPLGVPHPDYPNIVWYGNGGIYPAPGYTWEDQEKHTVKPYEDNTLATRLPWIPDRHKDHVVWTGDGKHIRATRGYRLLEKENGDVFVAPLERGTPDLLHPGLIWCGDGRVCPADGYRLRSGMEWQYSYQHPIEVVPLPDYTPFQSNLLWNGAGQLRPADGFRWVSPSGGGTWQTFKYKVEDDGIGRTWDPVRLTWRVTEVKPATVQWRTGRHPDYSVEKASSWQTVSRLWDKAAAHQLQAADYWGDIAAINAEQFLFDPAKFESNKVFDTGKDAGLHKYAALTFHSTNVLVDPIIPDFLKGKLANDSQFQNMITRRDRAKTDWRLSNGRLEKLTPLDPAAKNEIESIRNEGDKAAEAIEHENDIIADYMKKLANSPIAKKPYVLD